MAQFSSSITMDSKYQQYYWTYVQSLVEQRRANHPSQFITEADLSYTSVLKFVAAVSPVDLSEFTLKYLGDDAPPAKKSAKVKTAKAISAVTTSLKNTQIIDPQESYMTSVEEIGDWATYEEKLERERAEAISREKIKPSIAKCKPLKLPMSITGFDAFKLIFNNPPVNGPMQKSLHSASDCSICEAIGCRIPTRPTREGKKVRDKRALRTHEKVFSIALHHGLSFASSSKAFGDCMTSMLSGAQALLAAYDPDKNTVSLPATAPTPTSAVGFESLAQMYFASSGK